LAGVRAGNAQRRINLLRGDAKRVLETGHG